MDFRPSTFEASDTDRTVVEGNGYHTQTLLNGDAAAHRSSIEFAFAKGDAPSEKLEAYRAEANAYLLNPDNRALHFPRALQGREYLQWIWRRIRGDKQYVTTDLNDAEIARVRELMKKVHVMLPVYNQQATIRKTVHYLMEDLGIPPERITASSNSFDESDAILADMGIDVQRQNDTIEQYVDKDKLFGILGINNWSQIRGKGTTMFAGHLHDYMHGKVKPTDYVIQTDTDISNIGNAKGGWDPVTGLTWGFAQSPDIQAVKAAKNGRNNHPIHIAVNMLPVFGKAGSQYLRGIGVEQWPLTGEYGWRGDVTDRLRFATGYAVEMVLNANQVEMGLTRRGVALPEPRIDGQNFLTKETVMYADIMRTVAGILKNGRRLQELTLSEIAALNASIHDAFSEEPVFYCVEKDQSQKVVPNKSDSTQPSRIFPDFRTLQKEGILRKRV